MKWNLSADRPIYSQLVEQITKAIISGEYSAGDKLPSVRDLAEEAAVNPNTMQKALAELERNGLVFPQRTSGRFITEDTEMLKKIKSELASTLIKKLFEEMQNMGFSKEEAIKLIEEEK